MSTTMKAVKIKGETGPASALFIGDVDKPSPKEGEVLVKVRDSRRGSPVEPRALVLMLSLGVACRSSLLV